MRIIPILIVMTAAAVAIAEAQDRGFEIGQTLPDIPLLNLEGEEVRFSEFLGQQYVLYGWASW